MNARCMILLNPRAKALKDAAGMEQVRQMAREADIDADVIGTRSPDELSQTIRELAAAGAELVAVAGGDGTVSVAVQELAFTDTALGILPMGTHNNFATALRLPMDLPSALGVLRDGTVCEVGLGRVCGRYFTESAGVGLFADALTLYGAGQRKSLTRALVTTARLVFSLHARRLRLTIDGTPHVERAVMCVVANSFRLGMGLPVAPTAKLTDHDLDVVVVGDLRRSELIPYYRAFRAQTHLGLPKIATARAREVCIDSSHRLNIHCDDRIVGSTPATITSHPAALKVLVSGQ